MRRQTVVGGGSTASDARLVKDGQNVLQELDAALGTLLRRYTNSGSDWGNLISLGIGTSASLSRFFASDQIGTTRLLLDTSGAVVDDYLNSGFGEEIAMTGITINPFRFDGNWGYFTLTQRLLLSGARIYDPINGVWLSLDPIGFDGGAWNLFKYVRNNPIKFFDATGQSPASSREEACFSHLYKIYGSSSPPYYYCPKKACDEANKKCKSKMVCGPCGPSISKPYNSGYSQGVCNPYTLSDYADDYLHGSHGADRPKSGLQTGVCGGLNGADKMAHCFAACMVATCGGKIGGCLWLNFVNKGDELPDKQAEYAGLACGDPLRSLNSYAANCLECCSRATYPMRCD